MSEKPNKKLKVNRSKSSNKKNKLGGNKDIIETDKIPEPQENNNIYINPDFVPILNRLVDPTKNIFDYENNVEFSSNIDYPRFSYGFQHFIHQSKDKMQIVNDFKGKKKVYLVINNFERYIDEYEEDIGTLTKKYFEIEKLKKPDILSRGFYKLWEILILYDLIDINNKNFVSAHLAEGPGSFIQAVMFYREKFSKHSTSDKYYAVTLHPEDEGKHVPELESNFVKYYEKESPQRFILHKTYPKQIAGGNKKKDNGDITNPKTLLLFGGDMKEKADFITADGGFEWGYENIQEQEAFQLIFAQIVGAIMNQKQKGHFVCKFFETFTITSMKFVSILKACYNKVEIIKPLTSRLSNSEKYFICMDFKYSEKDKEYKLIVDKLLKMLKTIHETKDYKIVNMFSEYELEDNFLKNMIELNVKIENEQYKTINLIIKYIQEQNFYGDSYQMNRQKQINAAKFWTSHFLPSDNKELENIRLKLHKLYNLNLN
jgi:23S rRNA U2552 (ribose-2'-O)-methylase RlmE/FtsJ